MLTSLKYSDQISCGTTGLTLLEIFRCPGSRYLEQIWCLGSLVRLRSLVRSGAFSVVLGVVVVVHAERGICPHHSEKVSEDQTIWEGFILPQFLSWGLGM